MRSRFLHSKPLRMLIASGLISAAAFAAGSKPSAPAAKSAAPAKTTAKVSATGRAGTAGARGPSTSGAAKGPSVNGPTTGGGRGTAGPSTRGPIASGPAAGGRGTTNTPGVARTGGTSPGGRAGAAGTHFGSAAPGGSHTARLPNGNEIRTRANGQRSDLHDARRNMDVHNGLGGSRTVRVDRPDHSRIVAERGGRGYVQRPYAFRNRAFARRSYFVHGRPYDRFYRAYAFHGVALEVYAPVHYYPLGFYGWVYGPWVAPVPYAWGFAAAPWYGYYGVYFAPAPVYPTASLWLTDYMVASDLQDGYQARVEGGQPVQPLPPAGQAPLSPDVKAAIAREVQGQIALENQEAQQTAQNQDIDPNSSGIGRMLGDGASHVFVVGQDLDLVDSTGRECLVTPGDVLQLRAAPPANSTAASLLVLSSKGGSECGKASTVSVALNDLQEMQNQMRQTIDRGLDELQAKQGKGGLPAEPAGAAGAGVAAQFTQAAPPPEPNLSAEIAQQAQEADRAEAESAQASVDAGGGPSAAGGPPKQVGAGMSQDEVIAILGPPKSIVVLGPAKKMLVYSDMKVTLTSGKVTDIK